MTVSTKFNPVEFAATMARMAANKDVSMETQKPRYDPAVARDVTADAGHGRHIDSYRQVLEHYGFEMVPANRMLWKDGRPKTESEWRSRRLSMALTESDILSGWRGPEDFDTWIQETLMRRRARRAGLTLP